MSERCIAVCLYRILERLSAEMAQRQAESMEMEQLRNDLEVPPSHPPSPPPLPCARVEAEAQGPNEARPLGPNHFIFVT